MSDQSDQRTYSGVYHMNEWSGQETGGLYSQHSRGYVSDVTEADLQDYFSRSNELQNTFGDFGTYLSYMNDRQDLIDGGFNADWIAAPQATGEQTKANADMYFGLSQMQAQGIPLNAEQQATYDALTAQGYQADGGFMGTGSAGGIDTAADYQSSFDSVMGSDEMTALNEKYGISNEEFLNDSGSTMRWTGSGYIQTNEAEGLDFAYLAMMAAVSAFSMGAGGAIAGALAPGVTGAAAGALQGGIGATLGGAIQGDIDPKNIAVSALMGGLNPGGTVSNQLGLAPENFAGGFVQGAVNSAVGDGLRTGDIDAGSILQAGLLQGGMNSISNAWDALNNNTPEAIMDSIADQHRADYIKIHGSAAGYQGLSENQLFEIAMSQPLVNKTNFGALIGEGGLLPFIPELDISGLAQLKETLTGYDNGTELFTGPDGNYLTNAELIAAGQDPAAVYAASMEGGTGINGYTHAGYVDNPPSLLAQITDKITNVANQTPIGPVVGGLMDAAAAEAFKNQYGFYPQDDPALAQQVVAYGPLQENYSYSDNPRGDSEMFGTVYDNGNYTQGLTTLIDAATGLPSAIQVSQEQISAINEAGDAAREQQQQLLNNGYIINLGDQPTLPGAGLGNPFWEQFVESLTSSDPEETASTEITDAGVVEDEVTEEVTEEVTNETTEQVVDNVGDDPTQNTTTQIPGNSNYRQNQIIEMLGNTIASIPEAVLPPDPSTQLPPGSTPTLPGIDPRANPNNGVNPEWSDLYKYKRLEKWKKARDRQYAGIAGLLQQQSSPLNSTKRKYTQRQKSDMGLLS